MRVLHITRDFPPRHCGGLSAAVGGLADAQQRDGWAPAVVSFDAWRPRATRGAAAPPGESSRDGISVLRVSHAAHLPAAHAFARALRPTVVHVHDGMLWEFAAALREALGIPAVLGVHVVHQRVNELRATQERTLSLDAQEIALAAADRVIAPSHAAADTLLASRPALAPRLRVVAHGIADSPAARAAAARHVATAATGPLLSVGRFADVKGTPQLFDVMQSILVRRPEVDFVVAGGIPANRRAEARWLRRWHSRASEPQRARVRWTGWLDADAVGAWYRDAAALLVPSRYETFGLVALEAMLHGLPVAACAAGGLAELVDHDRTGLLSPPGDVDALVGHAIALISDPALARRLSRAAASAVRAALLWEHVLPALRAVYAEVR
jgi:glycosyltransferase involved in cell wall biosynthesis